MTDYLFTSREQHQVMQIAQEKADQIIQLAIDKGLLSSADLEHSQTPEAKRSLDQLISNGLLSEVMVRALERELDSDRPTPVAADSEITLQFSQDYPTFPSLTLKPLESANTPRAVKKFGRYDLIKLVGEGGMGSVYQAYDRGLKRYVALKFLHGTDPDAVQRLLREGRAQAKVEHPNICQVYEVNKLDDQLYIAMQYIDGLTLNKVGDQLTLEQKVRVMADVSAGLHAAHKEGLVHRDIKPQNIMVEKTVDGWKPYVMDFGLVREASHKGLTVTGEVLGTPSYMAPEQARGKNEQLDRRTDVYSLGATLYEMLSGKPPFQGFDVMDVLVQVLQEDPPPLRSIQPDLPIDLETIVMKSLEKEPAARYESAHALMEDLYRFLAEEPIAGQRAGLAQRARKLIRKHRTLVAVATIAFVALMGIGITTLRGQFQAAKRAKLAQQFGEQVKDMENIMRHGHMMALHDISREEGMVQKRIRDVSETIDKLGETGEGPGHYALGRGYQTLGDYDKARLHLERAWHNGYQEHENAYALGIVLGKLYQRRMIEIDQLENREQKDLERQKAEAELKSAARDYLSRGREAIGESSQYGEALMAFYDRRWDEARSQAEAAINEIPWLYEAKQLIGDIYLAIGNEQRDKHDYPAARRSYELARQAYEEAIVIGASDVSNYEGLSQLWLTIIGLNYFTGEDLETPLAELNSVVDRGLKANRRWIEGYTHRSLGYFLLAQYRSVKSTLDPVPDYQRAIAEAEKAVKINPDFIVAFNALGNCYLTLGQYQFNHGQNPTESLDKSVANYQTVLQINRQILIAYTSIGNAYSIKAQYQLSHGEDPRDTLAQAQEICQQALQIDPEFRFAYLSLGVSWWNRAQYQLLHGEDANNALTESINNYRQVLKQLPRHMPAFIYLGNSYLDQGRNQYNHGQDPTSNYDQALANYRSALLVSNSYPPTYNSISIAYWLKAQYQLSRGEDPSNELEQALINCRRALEINANFAAAQTTMSAVYWLQGEYQRLQGKSPDSAIDSALVTGQAALAINGKDAMSYLNIATSRWTLAKYRLAQGRLRSADLQPLFATLAQGGAINGNFFSINQYLGKANLLAAQLLIKENGDPAAVLAEAESALNRAIELNPYDGESYRAMAEWHRWRAEMLLKKGAAIDDELKAGLALIEKAHTLKPDLAEAYATESALYLLAKQPEPARLALARAIELNRLLANEYQLPGR